MPAETEYLTSPVAGFPERSSLWGAYRPHRESWLDDREVSDSSNGFDSGEFLRLMPNLPANAGDDWLDEETSELRSPSREVEVLAPSTLEPPSPSANSEFFEPHSFSELMQRLPDASADSWPAVEGGEEYRATDAPAHPTQPEPPPLLKRPPADPLKLDALAPDELAQLSPPPEGYGWFREAATGNITQRPIEDPPTAPPPPPGLPDRWYYHAESEFIPPWRPPLMGAPASDRHEAPAESPKPDQAPPPALPVPPQHGATHQPLPPVRIEPPPGRGDGFFATAGAQLRRGAFLAAAAATDAVASLATSPSRLSSDRRDQARLDATWKALEAIESARQQGLARARAQYPDGVLGWLEYLRSDERARANYRGVMERMFERDRLHLSNNRGWWQAGADLREEADDSYRIYQVDPHAQSFSAQAGRATGAVAEVLAHLPTRTPGIVTSTLARSYEDEYQRIDAEQRARGETDPLKIRAAAEHGARQLVKDEAPWITASTAASMTAPGVSRLLPAAAPQLARTAVGTAAPVVANLTLEATRRASDGESLFPGQERLLEIGGMAAVGMAAQRARSNPGQGKPKPSSLKGTEFSQKCRGALNAIEEHTGFRITEVQRARLIESLRTTRFEKLSADRALAHRREHARGRLEQIKEWERQTNQRWPTYSEDVFSKPGKLYRRKGAYYDAHHIISSDSGGPNVWWNYTPARSPGQHQAGLHLDLRILEVQ